MVNMNAITAPRTWSLCQGKPVRKEGLHAPASRWSIQPRVLMPTSTLPRWPGDSTPRFVLDLAAQLVAAGTDIRLLAPACPGAARAEQLDGVDIERFSYALPAGLQTLCYNGGMLPNLRAAPWRWALVPGFMTAALVAVRRAIRRWRPDVVNAHWVLPMGLIAVLAAPRGMPVVITVHGSDVLDLHGGLLDRLKAFVLSRTSLVTCNGSITEAALLRLGVPAAKIRRIPMGAAAPVPNVAHGLELPEAGFTLLFAGRLFRGKGLDDLLTALALLDAADRPLLLVAGTGPEEARFRAAARELGIGEAVRFLGGLEHRRLLALMAAVDVVVVPTRSTELIEAQGLVVAEAMLAGTPVIATTGGGPEDHIRDGVNGLLVPPADPAALAAAIDRIRRNPEAAVAMAEAGRRYAAEHLSWSACAQAFAEIYREAIAAAQGSNR